MSAARADQWLSLAISDIAVFGSGDLISVAKLSARSGSHPVPVYGGNGIAGYTSSAMIDQPTVILGRVGQKCGVVYRNAGPAWITDNALYARRFKRPLDVQFLTFALEAARLNDVKNRNDLPLITQSILNDVKIAWPDSLTEQRQISRAMADIADLIASLERMITKKQWIKQGMMQELLTGRTRLPGFTKQWEPKRLGDLLAYEQPGRYLVSSTEYGDVGTPVLTAGKTFILGRTTERNGIHYAVPVVIFDDFTTASKFVTFPFKVKSSAMKILSARLGVNIRYMYERMQLIDYPVVDHKRRWIAEYSKIEVEVPDDAEQRAIASVIDDADAEIHALEARIAKARAKKAGMMHELLTGRTRLPAKEGAA